MKGVAPLIVVLIMLLVAGASVATYVALEGLPFSDDWTINGTSVYINDDRLYLSATPHTLGSDGTVHFELVSKQFEGDVKVAFGFDGIARPTGARYYKFVNDTVEKSYTCDGDNWFNYTTEPKHFWCWNTQNNTDTLVSEHDFDHSNGNTAYWYETTITEWHDLGDYEHIEYSYEGMTDWYYTTFNVEKDKLYQLDVDIYVPLRTNGEHKYWACFWPDSETIEQAISNDHMYCLDPWLDTNFFQRSPINFNSSATNDITNFTFYMTVDTASMIASGNLSADCSDLRFTESDGATLLLWEWDDYNTSAPNGCGQAATGIWILLPELKADNSTTGYMYYNSSAPATLGNSSGYDYNTTVVLHMNSIIGGITPNAKGTTDANLFGNNNFNSTGRFGSGWIFENSNSDLNMSDTCDVDVGNVAGCGYDQYTLEMWIYTYASAGGTANNPVVKGANPYPLKLQIEDWVFSNRYGYSNLYDGASVLAVNGGTNVKNGNWHQLVQKFNTSQYNHFYVDGVLLNATAGANPITNYDNNEVMHIGTDQTFVYEMVGQMDEFVLQKTPRSHDYIKMRYDNAIYTMFNLGVMEENPDTTPPSVNITLPSNMTYYDQTEISFNVTADDSYSHISYCGYAIDSGGNVTMTNNSLTNWYHYNTSVPSGSHLATYCCNDTTNNWNCSESVYFANVPMISIISENATNPIYETFYYPFNVSVGINVPTGADVEAVLDWDGTEYAATDEANATAQNWTASYNMPIEFLSVNGSSIDYFWNFTLTLANGTTYYRNVTPSSQTAYFSYGWDAPTANVSTAIIGDGIMTYSNLTEVGNATCTVSNESAIWNNTIYLPSQSGIMYYRAVSAPYVLSTTNIEYFYTTTLTWEGDSTVRNSTHSTIAVSGVNITTCSDATDAILYRFYTRNEEGWGYLTSGFQATVRVYASYPDVYSTQNISYAGNISHQICIQPNTSVVNVDVDVMYHNQTELYPPRYYFIRNAIADNDTEEIDIFLLNTTYADNIQFQVIDANGEYQPDVLLNVQRYYEEYGLYQTAAMGLTGDDGYSNIRLRPYDVYYRIIASRNGTILRAFTPIAISSSSNILVIPAEAVGDYWIYKENIAYSCTWTNTTGILRCDATTTDGTSNTYWLNVWEFEPVSRTLICNETGSGSAVTLLCNVGINTTDDFRYLFYADFPNNDAVLIDDMINGMIEGAFGVYGLFFMFMLIIGLAFAGLFNPAASLIFAIIGLIVGSALNMVTISYGSLIGIILVLVIAIVRVKS